MPATYEPIATTTLGSAQTTVTFSSISQAYTDLILIQNASFDAGTNNAFVLLNNDTGTNYSNTYVLGDGSTASSGRNSNTSVGFNATYMSQTMNTTIYHFMNYSNTTTNKTAISRSSSSNLSALAAVSLWRSTAAISTITIKAGGSSNFNIGSTFTLYGIKAA